MLHRHFALLGLTLALGMAGCAVEDSDSGPGGTGGSGVGDDGGAGDGSDGGGDDGGGEDGQTSDPGTGTGGDGGGATDTGDGGSDPGDSGDTGTDGGDDGGGGTNPDGPSDLPEPTGDCPEFEAGTITVSPSANGSARNVRLWISEAAESQDGPLVFYWHGTGSSPMEAQYGLGQAAIDDILSRGGMVVAPESDPGTGQWPWFLVSGTQMDDLHVADEVLACAIEKVGVDTSHIHTLGMSAGGLQTSQMSLRRSSYLASVVTYSGGLGGGIAPASEDPSNKFAAMIFHGGPDDVVVISFKDASEAYRDTLQENGQFAFICDHGGGHTIPDAQDSVWQFFQDHPYGADPSPYASGLPSSFPSYCML